MAVAADVAVGIGPRDPRPQMGASAHVSGLADGPAGLDVQRERGLFVLSVERVEGIAQGACEGRQTAAIEAKRDGAEVDLDHPPAAARTLDPTQGALRQTSFHARIMKLIFNIARENS